MPNLITKTCCTCNEGKPLEAFNLYTKAADGHQPRCRQCQAEKRVEWYAKNREREIAKSTKWHKANPETGRAYSKARYWKDPEGAKKANKEYREKNSVAYLAQKHSKRAASLEESRERERLWRASSPDSIAERKRAYRKSNPNIRVNERANYHRRRALMTHGPTGAEIQAKLDYHGNLCWMCGDIGTAIDHVKPLAKGGLHMLANLRPACGPCNSRKRDRWYGMDRIEELRSWVLVRLAA